MSVVVLGVKLWFIFYAKFLKANEEVHSAQESGSGYSSYYKVKRVERSWKVCEDTLQ